MKEDALSSSKAEVACEILTYLSENPGAQDTLEGIAQWWLMERRIKYHISLIKEALEDLVGRGLVLEIKKEVLNPNYRLNDGRKEDIGALLEHGVSSGFGK